MSTGSEAPPRDIKHLKNVVRSGRYEVVGRGGTNWKVEVVRTGRSIIFCGTK